MFSGIEKWGKMGERGRAELQKPLHKTIQVHINNQRKKIYHGGG